MWYVFKQFDIKLMHILSVRCVSKQTKYLPEYEILSICISFSSLHLKTAEFVPNWRESPMSHSGSALHSREPFRTTRSLISANDCCTALKLDATNMRRVGARSEKLRLEIYVRRENCATRAHERGQPQSSCMHFSSRKKRKEILYITSLSGGGNKWDFCTLEFTNLWKI